MLLDSRDSVLLEGLLEYPPLEKPHRYTVTAQGSEGLSHGATTSAQPSTGRADEEYAARSRLGATQQGQLSVKGTNSTALKFLFVFCPLRPRLKRMDRWAPLPYKLEGKPAVSFSHTLSLSTTYSTYSTYSDQS